MTKAEIKAMRERMGTVATEARALLDTITEDMDASQVAEIEGRFDTMMADYDVLAARVDREERLAAAEARGMPSTTDADDSPVEGEGEDTGESRDYREVFDDAIRFGVAELSLEDRQTLREHYDSDLRAQAAGNDTAGGYTVPEGFSGEIDRAMADWGPMWDPNIVRELNTSNGNRLPWPTVDDTANEGQIKAENAAATDDGSGDVAFSEKLLEAYIYNTKIVRIPIELLQDSAFDMQVLLNDLFGERLGRAANRALTVGTGMGQPQGIVPAAAQGVAAVSNAAIVSDELIDLVHSVDPAYRASPRCRFMFNDSTLAAVRKLKDGQGNYLWQMGDVRADEPSMILDHPYSVNQAMPPIRRGNRAVLFGDFSRYVVRKIMGFQVMTLRERYAEHFQIGMVGFKRFDGELLNGHAVKALVLSSAP